MKFIYNLGAKDIPRAVFITLLHQFRDIRKQLTCKRVNAKSILVAAGKVGGGGGAG